MTDLEQRARVDLALTGFRQARKRFQELAVPNLKTPAASVLIPIIEALWWAISADEEFERALGKAYYRSARDADSDGQTMLGVLYARNRCGHQRALAVVRIGGLAPPLAPPLDPGVYYEWRPIAELPPADPGRSTTGAAQYELHLARRNVARTLTTVEAWLTKAEARLT